MINAASLLITRSHSIRCGGILLNQLSLTLHSSDPEDAPASLPQAVSVVESHGQKVENAVSALSQAYRVRRRSHAQDPDTPDLRLRQALSSHRHSHFPELLELVTKTALIAD